MPSRVKPSSAREPGTRPILRHFLSVFVLILCQCNGSGTGSGGTDAADTLTDMSSCNVPTLLAARCDGGACHGATNTAAALDLVSPGLEARVLGERATQCIGVLADPARPETSVLYDKLLETPRCGARMPLQDEPFTQEEIDCVRAWISGLLPSAAGTDDGGNDGTTSNGGNDGDETGAACTPDDVQACYTGPSNTRDVGLCVGGEQTCGSDGTWGACVGEVTPILENCLTEDDDEDCNGSTPACTRTWAISPGTTDAEAFRGVATDSENNVIVVGDFFGAVSFGGDVLEADNGKYDVVVAKYDSFGNHVWSKSFGDSSNQYAGDVVVDSNDNIIIVGRAFGSIDFGGSTLNSEGLDDTFVAKFDANGGHIWSDIIGGADGDRSERVSVDASDNVLVIGAFNGAGNFGMGTLTSAGSRDVFMVKFAAETGLPLLSQRIGGTGDDYGWGIRSDSSSSIYITGFMSDTVDFGGGDLTSAGDTDVFVAKYNSSGAHVWSQRMGSTGQDYAYDLAVNPTTGVVWVTGAFSGTVDFGGGDVVSAGSRDMFLASFDEDGVHQTSEGFGDSLDQFETEFASNTWNRLCLDGVGNVHVVGGFAGTMNLSGSSLASAGFLDAFIGKFSSAGSGTYSIAFGRSSTEQFTGCAVSSDGYLAAVGRTFGSSVDFGSSGTISGEGSADPLAVTFLLP